MKLVGARAASPLTELLAAAGFDVLAFDGGGEVSRAVEHLLGAPVRYASDVHSALFVEPPIPAMASFGALVEDCALHAAGVRTKTLTWARVDGVRTRRVSWFAPGPPRAIASGQQGWIAQPARKPTDHLVLVAGSEVIARALGAADLHTAAGLVARLVLVELEGTPESETNARLLAWAAARAPIARAP